jgi:hypothetical protein
MPSANIRLPPSGDYPTTDYPINPATDYLTTSLPAMTLARSRYRFTPPQAIETKYLGAYFEAGAALGVEGARSVAAAERLEE